MVDLDSRRVHGVALVVLAVFLYGPYALAGPGFFIDDWFALANGALDRWWMSAGPAQWRARPGASAVYAVTFGLIGERPVVHFLLAVLALTGTAIVLYRLGSRFLPPVAALGASALWLTLPTHTSLEMWPSCLNIALALLLLALGAERLTHPTPTSQQAVVAALLFGVGTLAYEAIAPAAVAIAVAVAVWRRGKVGLHALIPTVVAVGAAGIWMLLNWHPDKVGLDVTMNPWAVIPAHFGETITGDARWAGLVVVVAVLVGSVLAARDAVVSARRSRTDWRHWTIGTGWAVIGVGTLPFVRYFYSPIGLGDRTLVVSSVGGAMVILGVVALLGGVHLLSGGIFAAIVLAAALPQRYSMAADYAVAADDGRRIRAAVLHRWPSPPAGGLVLGPEPIVRRNVVAFYDVGSALALLYDDGSVQARMTYSEEEFQEAPAEFKVDIRPLSKLDDERLDRPSSDDTGGS